MNQRLQTRRLLIVEDEPGDARLMQLAIVRNGFATEMSSAADGREAMRCLRREGARWAGAVHPDLILLDLKMPGQGGLEFLAAIKQDETLRAIPVVVVTTSLLEADVRRAYELGAAGYVQKPADLREFIATVRILGEYWFKLVRLPQNGE
ncbi:response regulator [Accumulibacter sp.]|jgi:CheY-like chemotaxis protein|uniref:Response regulator receiver protein n=1 Tax=Accumulibacter regalis TaxID=522306 RepID=C7RS24_ACCRE|nr:response regulator [Accumulibacter sp.]MBN8497124.1 response regulator [Accumulibacter sp.]MBO3715825.1 response regulator [Accumulibacter sp.]